jgi:hypothetical protein
LELKSVFVFCARRRGILPPRPTNRNLPARVARPAQRPRVPLPPLPWVAPDERRDLRRQDAARDRSCLPTHTHSGRRSPPPTTPPGPALSRGAERRFRDPAPSKYPGVVRWASLHSYTSGVPQHLPSLRASDSSLQLQLTLECVVFSAAVFLLLRSQIDLVESCN